MNKTRVRDAAFVMGALAILAAVLAAPRLVLGRLDFFKWDAPRVGTVLAERRSPDGAFVATVTAADSIGHYSFVLRQGSQIVARQDVSAPVGYHGHIVSLEWAPDGSRVFTTIDHDLGDTLRFVLERPRKVF